VHFIINGRTDIVGNIELRGIHDGYCSAPSRLLADSSLAQASGESSCVSFEQVQTLASNTEATIASSAKTALLGPVVSSCREHLSCVQKTNVSSNS
jgi:hypothetical protein